MRHLDLCSGIGGFALAAEWAGLETIGFSEIDPHSNEVLRARWPHIKNYGNIKDINGSTFKDLGIITGGYPCQPYSVAGSQKAEKDDRHLWPEMFRIIREAGPTWVLCENVYGHIKLGLDNVLDDLESINYAAQSFVIPALSKGADHLRKRVFIVAHAPGDGCDGRQEPGGDGASDERGKKGTDQDCHNERRGGLRPKVGRRSYAPRPGRAKPPEIRVANGLADRAYRIKGVGNAVMPQIVYEFMRLMVT